MSTVRLYKSARQKREIGFWLIYTLSVIFSLHGTITMYSSSTYMEQFTSTTVIGALYTISSCLSVLAFLFIARVLQQVGNVKLTLWLALFEIASLLILGATTAPAIAIVAFVLYMIINPLLYLTIDIFSETLIGSNETGTGSKRGLTLTLMSTASVLGPLLMGLIVGGNDDNLHHTYYAAAGVFFVFIILILTRFRDFEDPQYKELKVLTALHSFWQHHDVRFVFLGQLLLQIFFSWAVIYIPLYLATVVGFSWETIGAITAVGLAAYVFLEWPIGYLADTRWGEKEMMAIGFLIISLTVAAVSFMATAPIIAWMGLMFMNRAGASLVEATGESYFFKHTTGSDANIMSFFRLTRPLGTIFGALLGSVTLLFLPFELSFVVLALCMLPGIYFSSLITDTR